MDKKSVSDAMKVPTRRVCLGSALLACCAAMVPAFAAVPLPKGALPIWVSPQLGLGAEVSDPATAALRAMAEPFEDNLHMTIRSGTTREVHDCSELMADVTNIVGAPSDQEYRVLRFTAARCRALWFLTVATPATETFLGDFRLDGENLRYLPPGLALAVSPDDQKRVRQVEEAGGNIQSLDPTVKLVPGKGRDGETIPNTAQLESENWTAKLTLLARADFDRDGLEDVLLRRDAATKGGTYALTSIFVLTRREPNHRLDIIWPPRR